MATQYKFFATANECADAAAPIFEKRKWYWKQNTHQRYGYIPNRNEIRDELLRLAELSHKNEGREAETGRLIVVGGRFGYLDPVNPLQGN